MRTPADQVGSGIERIVQQGALVRARLPDDGPVAQRDDLDVDEVGDPPPHLAQGLDTAQAVIGGEIGVGPHEAIAVAGHETRRSLRAFDDVLDAEQVAVGPHRLDRAHQVTVGVRDLLGQECLVEMRVWFDRRRRQQVAREVERFVSCRSDRRSDLGDHSVDDQHVVRRLVCHGRVNNRDLL